MHPDGLPLQLGANRVAGRQMGENYREDHKSWSEVLGTARLVIHHLEALGVEPQMAPAVQSQVQMGSLGCNLAPLGCLELLEQVHCC